MCDYWTLPKTLLTPVSAGSGPTWSATAGWCSSVKSPMATTRDVVNAGGRVGALPVGSRWMKMHTVGQTRIGSWPLWGSSEKRKQSHVQAESQGLVADRVPRNDARSKARSDQRQRRNSSIRLFLSQSIAWRDLHLCLADVAIGGGS